MTFREILEEMSGKDPRIQGGALAGSDGLPVDEWHAPGAQHDFSALCAEMVQFFRESERIASENGLGGAAEICLSGEGGSVFVRQVTEEYLLIMVADPAAIPGKCRYLLRQGARSARAIL